MGKTTKVLLVCPQHNMKREFEITHAERLLMDKTASRYLH